MGITIARNDVKRKCRLIGSAFDADVDALIAEMAPVIEFSIAERYLNDTGNAGLQATLKLGALEVICGEFLAQMLREDGATDVVRIADISLGDRPRSPADLIDPFGLKRQGAERLAPFLKPSLTMQAGIRPAGRARDQVFTEDQTGRW